MRKARKQKYKLTGGPFDGESVYLADPGTAVIKVREYCGYYDRNGRWVNA